MARLLAQGKEPDIYDQSYLISVSDMMSGLVFVFMLILMIFAIQFKEASDFQVEVARLQSEVITELTGAERIRRRMLEEIEASLLERGVEVRVDLEQGILRLPESILFPSGSATLNDDGRQALSVLAAVLRETLPCYTASGHSSCAVERRGKLETVFIEGHTDDVPINNPVFPDNWTLSTSRAIRTFQVILTEQPELDALRNDHGMPIFTVSGYADRRPVAENATEEGRRLNRRIDLRFVMASPNTPPVVDEVQAALVQERD